jgi:hypothetical protein
MNSTASSRTSSSAIAGSLLLGLLAGCATPPATDGLLFSDDFVDARNWVAEQEKPAADGTPLVVASDGAMNIDTPAGLTLWFKHELTGPVEIEFQATAVQNGGPNDQVSDLNVFWMASNRDGAKPVFNHLRTGRFGEYDDLLTYYVGLGGNRNTTSRFRRYIGEPGNRPLLPAHDLSAPDTLLIPNRKQTITLIADGRRIEYRRDGRPLFVFDDPAPYTRGWFALRTTYSHLRIEKLRIRRPRG